MNTNLRNKSAQAFKIEEGDTVVDAANNEIGSVLTFRFSDDNPRTSVAEAATPSVPDARPASIIDGVIDAFAGETDMPQELRENLLQHGFIRIRQGMFAPDLFATMDQVARVADHTIYLNAVKDQLPAR